MKSDSTVIFDPDGNILPCNEFVNHPFAKFGQDYNTAEELDAIWKSEDHVELIEASNWIPIKKCLTCPKWTICGGGCIIKWMYFHPTDFLPFD